MRQSRRASITILAILVVLAWLLAATLPAQASARGRLIIARLHLDVPIGLDLGLGPAFYPGSGHPGEQATIAIAGHRTTHTRPFWSLDLLRRGDRIAIVWGGVRHVYLVTGSRVVAPTDWQITRDLGRERLILSTCTPRFSARERLIVFAHPTST